MLLWVQRMLPLRQLTCVCVGTLKGLFLCPAFLHKSHYIPDSRGCSARMGG